MKLKEDIFSFVEQKSTTLVFTFQGLFLLFFIPSLVFFYFISKDTSEDPLEEGINFFNSTSFNYGNNINTYIDIFNFKDENPVDCSRIYELIKVKNQSLSEIFTLNTRKINFLAKSLIALKFVTLAFVILAFILYLKNLAEKKSNVPIKDSGSKNSTEQCCASFCLIFISCMIGLCCTALLLIGFAIFLIVEIILFSVISAKYNNDETKKFLNFLQCDGISHNIIEKFSSLNNLSLHFTLIKILNSVYIVFFVVFGIIVALSFLIDFPIDDNKGDDKEKALSN